MIQIPYWKNGLWWKPMFIFVGFGLLGVYFTIEPYFYSDKTATWVNLEKAKIVYRKMEIWVRWCSLFYCGHFKERFKYIQNILLIHLFEIHLNKIPQPLWRTPEVVNSSFASIAPSSYSALLYSV